MHERTIHSVLPQGQTVQKGGLNPPNPRKITPLVLVSPEHVLRKIDHCTFRAQNL